MWIQKFVSRRFCISSDGGIRWPNHSILFILIEWLYSRTLSTDSIAKILCYHTYFVNQPKLLLIANNLNYFPLKEVTKKVMTISRIIFRLRVNHSVSKPFQRSQILRRQSLSLHLFQNSSTILNVLWTQNFISGRFCILCDGGIR